LFLVKLYGALIGWSICWMSRRRCI
jgi:hypothetical protein